jgi:Asp-tRNA(Asn)/Glu-tRNA(Gln) amidotransferase A subunit family amidase
MRFTKAALKKAGHRVVPYHNEHFDKLLEAYIALCISGHEIDLEGEKLIEEYQLQQQIASIPECLRPILSKILHLVGKKREALSLKHIGSTDSLKYVYGAFKRHVGIDEAEEVWKGQELDCIISPAGGIPPYKHGESSHLIVS